MFSRKKFLLTVFLLFLILPAYSRGVVKFSVFNTFNWDIETTSGVQNVKHYVTSEESGATSEIDENLTVQGIIFHSFYKYYLINKTQLSLGFSKKGKLLWSDNPDLDNDYRINERLKTTEIETQFFLSFLRTRYYHLFPFIGYSFFSYSYDDNFRAGNYTFSYNSVNIGLQFFYEVNRRLALTSFFSFSPSFLVYNSQYKEAATYFNFGLEMTVRMRPFFLTGFATLRKNTQGHYLSDIKTDSEFEFRAIEIGFSFVLNPQKFN